MTPPRFRLVPMLVAAAALGAAAPSFAGERTPDPDRVRTHLQAAADRLELTPSQREQMKSLLDDLAGKLEAIRAKYPAEPTRSQKREMARQMRPLRDEYEAKVAGVLNDEQEKEWARMREENREKLREARKQRVATS